MHYGANLSYAKANLLVQNIVSNPLNAALCCCGVSNLKSVRPALENPLHWCWISTIMCHCHELVGQSTDEIKVAVCLLFSIFYTHHTLLQPLDGPLPLLICLLNYHQSSQFDDSRILWYVILYIQPSTIIPNAQNC